MNVCYILPYLFMCRFWEDSKFMLLVDVMCKEKNSSGCFFGSVHVLTEHWSLIILGTRSECVTPNSGSNGLKDVCAMSKDFGSVVWLRIEFLQWVL